MLLKAMECCCAAASVTSARAEKRSSFLWSTQGREVWRQDAQKICSIIILGAEQTDLAPAAESLAQVSVSCLGFFHSHRNPQASPSSAKCWGAPGTQRGTHFRTSSHWSWKDFRKEIFSLIFPGWRAAVSQACWEWFKPGFYPFKHLHFFLI